MKMRAGEWRENLGRKLFLYSEIMMEKYDWSVTKTVLEISIYCCMLAQATHATLDILGLATTRRWRNQNLLGWCNEVRTLSRSSGSVCGGGGGLCTFFIIYATSPSAERAVSSTKRWVCTEMVRYNKLDSKVIIMLNNVGFCLVLLWYSNHLVTPNTPNQHLMSSRTQTVMN